MLRPGGALILAHISRRSYFALMQPIRWLLGRRDVAIRPWGTDPSLGPFCAVGAARRGAGAGQRWLPPRAWCQSLPTAAGGRGPASGTGAASAALLRTVSGTDALQPHSAATFGCSNRGASSNWPCIASDRAQRSTVLTGRRRSRVSPTIGCGRRRPVARRVAPVHGVEHTARTATSIVVDLALHRATGQDRYWERAQRPRSARCRTPGA